MITSRPDHRATPSDPTPADSEPQRGAPRGGGTSTRMLPRPARLPRAMVGSGSCPKRAQIGTDIGLLRAASSRRRPSCDRLTGWAPPDRTARCSAPMPVPNREPVLLGRRAEHAWIAHSVQAGRRCTNDKECVHGERASASLTRRGDFAMGYSQSKLSSIFVSTCSCAPRVFAAPVRGRKAV